MGPPGPISTNLSGAPQSIDVMRAFLATVIVLAAGCAGPGSFVGRAEADLRAGMGPPLAEYRNPDGSRTLAYSYGQFSGQTYLADVDGTGSVRGVRQVLVEENFARLQPGMTRDEVLRLIGPPVDSMAFPRRAEISWEYRFIDTWGYRALFYVNLDERGIVVSKLTRRIENDRATIR
jgi:hypothetical protein